MTSENNLCYTRPPATPILLRKNTPTPDMSHLGVYTPDSSTNSGFNSADMDANPLSLESPSSLNSNEMHPPNSVEQPSPQTSTPPHAYIEPMHSVGNYCSSERDSAVNVSISTTLNTHHNNKTTNCAPLVSMHSNPPTQVHHHIPHSVSHVHHQQSPSYNQHPASAALSNMVGNNSVGTLLLGQGPTVTPANNYINTVNIGMSSTTASNPVGGSYMVSMPITTVIQPQSSTINHQQNQASHGTMQRLSHISMPIATSCTSASSHTYHMQNSNYNCTNASNQNTSCSIAKLQQLTNGLVEITPNQLAGYPSMTPPPSYNSPNHQTNLTPPPQMQRPIAPSIPNIQPQPSLPTNQVHYPNYNHRYHPRPVQRTSNIAISPNIVASYQTLNSVGYRMQQPSPLSSSTTLLNTGYIANAGFINSPSPAMPMGVVNMHPQNQYQYASSDIQHKVI